MGSRSGWLVGGACGALSLATACGSSSDRNRNQSTGGPGEVVATAGAAGAAGAPAGEPEEASCEVTLCTASQCSSLQVPVPTCDSPLRLPSLDSSVLGWQTVTLTANTECLQQTRRSQGETQAPTEFVLKLDLAGLPDPLPVQLSVDADFDPTVGVQRGPCGDPAEVGFNSDHAEGVERAFVGATLAPDLYRVVVGSQDSESAGEFQLSVASLPNANGCSFRAVNDTCEGAIELDSSRARQTQVGSLRCASDNSWAGNLCHTDASDPDVYYHLDLSDRRERTLIRATTDLPPTNAETILYLMEDIDGHCFAAIGCSSSIDFEAVAIGAHELWADVAPGKYFLAVDGNNYGEIAADFGLLVELSDVDCPGHRSYEQAFELDSVFGEQTHDFVPWCAGRTNRLFYKLDLSHRSSVTHVEIEASEGAEVSVHSAEPDHLLLYEWYEEVSVGLPPGVYYVVLELDTQNNAAPYNNPDNYRPGTLRVNLHEVSEASASCLSEEMLLCVSDTHYACCDGSYGLCRLVYQACGLAVDIYDCVCERSPECCANPAGYNEDCAEAFEACNLVCSGIDPLESCL